MWQNQGNFTFKQDCITKEAHSRQANHIHKANSAAQEPSTGFSLPRTSTHFTQSFHYPSGENSPIIPFFKRNQEKPNKKFKSWFCYPPPVWFYEDKKIPTLQMNQMLSIGVSSCMYNGWTRITVSEKARICDLRLNWYSHTWKPMNMVWKFSIKTEFTPKLAF